MFDSGLATIYAVRLQKFRAGKSGWSACHPTVKRPRREAAYSVVLQGNPMKEHRTGEKDKTARLAVPVVAAALTLVSLLAAAAQAADTPSPLGSPDRFGLVERRA